LTGHCSLAELAHSGGGRFAAAGALRAFPFNNLQRSEQAQNVPSFARDGHIHQGLRVWQEGGI
jgi:hypothetical protein